MARLLGKEPGAVKVYPRLSGASPIAYSVYVAELVCLNLFLINFIETYKIAS